VGFLEAEHLARLAVRRRGFEFAELKVDDPVFTRLDECTKDTADTCIQK